MQEMVRFSVIQIILWAVRSNNIPYIMIIFIKKIASSHLKWLYIVKILAPVMIKIQDNQTNKQAAQINNNASQKTETKDYLLELKNEDQNEALPKNNNS